MIKIMNFTNKKKKVITIITLLIILILAAVIILNKTASDKEAMNTSELDRLKVFIVTKEPSDKKSTLEYYMDNGKLLFSGKDIESFDWENQTVKNDSKIYGNTSR